jgi:FMN phosphatase YigB (HAD superfamily)
MYMLYSLFDIWWTLIDTVSSKKAAAYDFVKEKKFSISEEELSTFLTNLNIDRTRTRDLVESIFQMRNWKATDEDYSLFRKIEKNHKKSLIPGTEDFLAKLQNEWHTLAVVTNWKNFNKDGELFPKELHDFFPAGNIFYRKNASIPKKPSPYLYEYALSSLWAQAENVIVYEDTPRWIQAAIGAWISNCIGMATSEHHNERILLLEWAKEVRKNYL